MKKFTVLSLLLAGALSFQTSAAMLQTDWKSTGDALATLDTETGIEWLDLTQTYNLSLAQMNARLSSDLAGWRYATFDEVVSLVSRFFDSPTSTWKSQTLPAVNDTLAKRTQWRSLFGVNGEGSLEGMSLGAVRKNPLDDARWSIAGVYRYGNDVTYIPSLTDARYDYSAQNGYSGYFIVNDGGITLSSTQDPTLNINNPNAPVNNQPAPVNAPAGVALFGVLLSLVMGRRKQKE